MIFAKIKDTDHSANYEVGKQKIMHFESFIKLAICILSLYANKIIKVLVF